MRTLSIHYIFFSASFNQKIYSGGMRVGKIFRVGGGPLPPWPIRDFSRPTRSDSGPLGAKLHGREKSRGLWGSPTARAGNLVISGDRVS